MAPLISTFAERMLEEFTKQYPEKEESYKDMELIELINMMSEKFNDVLELDLESDKDLITLIRKCTHVGNFCAMISENAAEDLMRNNIES